MVIHQIIEAAPQSRSCALLDGHDVPFHCLMGTAHTSAHDKTLKTVLVPMQESGMKRKKFRSGTSLLCGFLWFYTL